MLLTLALSGCSSSGDDLFVPSESDVAEAPVGTTENPRDLDIEAQPFLEFAASEGTVGSITYYAGGLSYSQDHEDFEYGSADIALMMSQYEGDISTASATDLGNYTFYAVATPRWTDPDYFISNKGESIDNAFALLQHPDISLEEAIINDSGDVFLLLPFEIFCASDNAAGYYPTSNRKISSNSDYVMLSNNNTTSCPNNGFEYTVFSFDNEDCYTINVPEAVFNSRYTTFSNYIIGDNGQVVMCDGPITGVGTEWEKYDDTGYQLYVTGYGANNIYTANVSGLIFYASDDYLVYSDKYSLYKFDGTGSAELVNYADFANPYYTIERTFYNDLDASPSQIFFSEDSIFNGDSVYIYDCIALKLSNGTYFANEAAFGYDSVGKFVVTE
ncbi:MAG: hypothetical protein EOM14_02340 [Clostridia bacterium]|nr:hypothetical protein [Clostridia bacterium]